MFKMILAGQLSIYSAVVYARFCVDARENNRELKQLRRRRRRQLQETIDLMIKTTSRILVYFFDVHCTTTT